MDPADLAANRRRARALPIYARGEIPEDRNIAVEDDSSGFKDVLVLFFRSWPFIRPMLVGEWFSPREMRATPPSEPSGIRKWWLSVSSSRNLIVLSLWWLIEIPIWLLLKAWGLVRPIVYWFVSRLYQGGDGREHGEADAIAAEGYGFGYAAVLTVVAAIGFPMVFLMEISSGLAEWLLWPSALAVCVSMSLLSVAHRVGIGEHKGEEAAAKELEFARYCLAALVISNVAVVSAALVALDTSLAIIFSTLLTLMFGACYLLGRKRLPMFALVAVLLSNISVNIVTTFVIDGLVDGAYAGILSALCLLGWMVQVRRDGTKVRMRVRIASHLAYRYAIDFFNRFVNFGIALINADLINQSLFQGEPLAPGLASLLGFERFSSLNVFELSKDDRYELLWFYLILNISVALFQRLLGIVMGYYNMWILQMVNQNLRVALVERWHLLSMNYHNDHRTGDSIFRIYQDSSMVTAVIDKLIDLTLACCTYLSCVALVSLLSPWLGLAAIVLTVPGFMWAAWAMPRVRVRSLVYRATTSDVTSTVQESFGAIRVIKAFTNSDKAQERLERDSVVSFNAAFRCREIIALVTIFMFTFAAMFMMAGEFTMAWWAYNESPSFAIELIQLVGLSFVVWNLASFEYARGEYRGGANMIRHLLRQWMTAQDMAMGLQRVFDILDIEPDIKDRPGAVPLEGFKNRIEFDHVKFHYDPERPVLDDVSFKAEMGTITAIIGPTGSGKSSLLSLLLRLFDPQEGRILIDEKDLRDYQVASVRKNIAIALQENVLFALSVRDNIRYVAPDATEEEVEEAIRVSVMDDYVSGLPHGLDTVLSDRGGKLSSGQKQRLTIARAIVKNTPILILDEPTAALDAATEHQVMQNLSEWGQERAIFLVTHRISTIRQADSILYLDEGRIVESGNHQELMNVEGGHYRSFVEKELALSDLTQGTLS